MKKLLLILLLCSPLFAANDFSGDVNCVAYYSVEAANFSGATVTGDIGISLSNPASVTSDTTTFKVGAGSAFWNAAADRLSTTDTPAAAWPFSNAGTQRQGTFVFWVNPDTGARIIMSKGRATTNDFVFDLQIDASRNPKMDIGTGTGSTSEEWTTSGAALTVDQWYHISYSFDNATKAGHIRVYDATGDSVTNHTNTFSNNINIEAPAYDFGHLVGDVVPWLGQIDDFQVFDDILTNDEIDDIRNGVYSVGGGNGAVLNHGFSF